MPNTPISLQRAPPTTKGTASKETMLETLPDINTTVQGMATMWLLSKQSTDFVSTVPEPSPPPAQTRKPNVPLIPSGGSRPVPRPTFQRGDPLQADAGLPSRSKRVER